MSSAHNKALQKWREEQAKNQAKAAEEKAKKVKKEPKAKAPPVRKTIGKTNVKAEPITDMKAHLRTHVLPKDSSIPLQKQVRDSLGALQKAQEALTPAQLEEQTGYPCGPGTALADQLEHNPKVLVIDGNFKFKAASDVTVHDRAGALSFIQKSNGCLLRDLKIAYEHAEKDMEKMKKEGLVWVLPAAEKGQSMIFPRDKPPLITVSESVMKQWLSLKMPEDLEEEAREMSRANIQSAVAEGKRDRPRLQKKEREKKKRPTNFSRFTRITNAHLPELFKGEAGSID